MVSRIRIRLTSSQARSLILGLRLSLMFVIFFISYTKIARERLIRQVAAASIKPTCPISDNIKACVHQSVDLTKFAKICPNFTPAVNCHYRTTYDLIVTDAKFIEEVSLHTNKIIVPGVFIGDELDRFVQKDSRWIIDVMGGKGYEILTSVEDIERLALQKLLDRLQNRCTNFFNGGRGFAGFGSNWHNLGLALTNSIHRNTTFFPLFDYPNFINMTTCTKAELESTFAAHPPETNFTKWDAGTGNFKSLGYDIVDMMQNKELIQPEYSHKSLLWWRSMLTYYAIRPNFKMREMIRATTTATTPCISMHVRHSDKYTETTPIEFKEYMKVAKRMKARTGIANIYLMSDDPKVIEASHSYSGFVFHYMNMPRSNKGWIVDRDEGMSMDFMEKNFLIDIYSASQCHHNIVTYSSNVGRLIGELAYAIRNVVPDVVSLDDEWFVLP